MRRAARRDTAEGPILAALARAGCRVAPLSGPGVPDLLVGHKGRLMLFEVKSGRAKRTPLQDQFFALWAGYPIHVVRTPAEALAAVGLRAEAARLRESEGK